MSYAVLTTKERKTNLLGRELNAEELAIWHTYLELKSLAQAPGLPPCAASNIRMALANIWQVVNDLAIEFEQLDEIGV